ncbi:TolC family protein [uncultured Piscinibacter sp.]|uniref:TolC family protein n=1 Tax=uncultured Piscinibacter sp. TaxID=1131835 RepID=UPI002606034D|nr:TolC family protein [uncultured Piscinibacter sp.]
MRNPPRLAACVLAGSLLFGPVASQPAPAPDRSQRPAIGASAALASAPLTLATALELAWQRAVSARESHAQRRRADAEQAAATSLWGAPPALELSHRNDRWNDNTGARETEVGVAVPLWLPGQRAARGAAAQGAIAQADAATQAARLRLAGELREAAWAVAAWQAEAVQAEALTVSHRQLADDVERRVRAGDLARADALVARAELLAAQGQHAEVLQQLQSARIRWALLTGMTADPALEGQAGPEDAGAPLAATHPELELARQNTVHARQQLDLMRQSRREPPELTLGVRQDVPGRAEASRNSVVVGLRLPFGTDDRNRPLEAAALSELDIAQTAEQRLRERLEGELATARDALRSAQVQAAVESDRARLLRERATLIDKSFRAGETSLPELLRALAAAAQADSASNRQAVTLGLARARLQQALGLLP